MMSKDWFGPPWRNEEIRLFMVSGVYFPPYKDIEESQPGFDGEVYDDNGNKTRMPREARTHWI